MTSASRTSAMPTGAGSCPATERTPSICWPQRFDRRPLTQKTSTSAPDLRDWRQSLRRRGAFPSEQAQAVQRRPCSCSYRVSTLGAVDLCHIPALFARPKKCYRANISVRPCPDWSKVQAEAFYRWGWWGQGLVRPSSSLRALDCPAASADGIVGSDRTYSITISPGFPVLF